MHKVQRISPLVHISADGSYRQYPVWGDGFQISVTAVSDLDSTRVVSVYLSLEGGGVIERFSFSAPARRNLTRYDLIQECSKYLNRMRAA